MNRIVSTIFCMKSRTVAMVRFLILAVVTYSQCSLAYDVSKTDTRVLEAIKNFSRRQGVSVSSLECFDHIGRIRGSASRTACSNTDPSNCAVIWGEESGPVGGIDVCQFITSTGMHCSVAPGWGGGNIDCNDPNSEQHAGMISGPLTDGSRVLTYGLQTGRYMSARKFDANPPLLFAGHHSPPIVTQCPGGHYTRHGVWICP